MVLGHAAAANAVAGAEAAGGALDAAGGNRNVPASLAPGGGAECSSNLLSASDTTVANAIGLCPALAADPTGPFPRECASFDQLGFRVPFLAVSPFSKRSYVSHATGDHTSLLAFIEQRFLRGSGGGPRPHLTARDQHANTLEDLFDFDRAPSLNEVIPPPAPPPAVDCTPLGLPPATSP